MSNKITLELELPDTDNVEELQISLLKQAEFIIQTWGNLVNSLAKEHKISVPTLYLKKARPVKIEDKSFFQELIGYHLKFMPKDNVGRQMRVLRELYAAGYTKDQLIQMYDDSRAQYALTTWFTVKYNINKKARTAPISVNEFERRPLSDEDKDEIKKRLALTKSVT